MEWQTSSQTTLEKQDHMCASAGPTVWFPAVLSPLKHSGVQLGFFSLPATCQRWLLRSIKDSERRKVTDKKTPPVSTAALQFLLGWSRKQVCLEEQNKTSSMECFLLRRSPSLSGFDMTASMQQTRAEMGLTDRLQNFNLISREHLYGDTNQTTSRLIKTASQLKWQEKRENLKIKGNRRAHCREKAKDIYWNVLRVIKRQRDDVTDSTREDAHTVTFSCGRMKSFVHSHFYY